MTDYELFVMFIEMFGIKYLQFGAASNFDILIVTEGGAGFYFDPDTGSLLQQSFPVKVT